MTSLRDLASLHLLSQFSLYKLSNFRAGVITGANRQVSDLTLAIIGALFVQAAEAGQIVGHGEVP
jgi:hypothetical protein